MNVLLLVSTVLDLAAVAALGWFLHRTDREREVALEEGRAALERLRGDLAELVRDAEERARALEERVGARAAAASRPASERELLARRLGVDPAEARLLRDLEVSLGEGRRA
jgi:hypothetical protein